MDKLAQLWAAIGAGEWGTALGVLWAAMLSDLASIAWLGGALVVVAVVWSLAYVIASRLARPLDTVLRLHPAASGPRSTLVVAVHGLPGLQNFGGALDLIEQTLPEADRLVVDYRGGWVRGYTSNADALSVADVIEQGIHAHFKRGQYERVILVGYSAGASLLRKALVWGYGEEQDRAAFGRRGKRAWVDKAERMVLLAGMNRGWSFESKPELMSWPTCLLYRFLHGAGRALGIGGLVSAMRRGSPFISDTRLQWVRLARSDAVVEGSLHFPQVIQLIGSEDDLVSKEDGQDLSASAGTVFKTLAQTGHKEIGSALGEVGSIAADERRRVIALALLGKVDELEPDVMEHKEEREVSRLVYVMHGIRDLGEWTDQLREELRHHYEVGGDKVAIFSAKYGHFPMARFLMPFDRQRKVRYFMDVYTEHMARYPNAKSMDYLGHSHGTYILASALLRYVTMRVRRTFFAGSVMPYSYPWVELVDAQRVEGVMNVVATRDWVVAIFPKMFQQIASLFGRDNRRGVFDLGGAGFDGFAASGMTPAVDNLEYSIGAHSTGVKVGDPKKLAAICAYLASGEKTGLSVFETAAKKNGLLKLASKVSPLIWMALLVLLWALFSIASLLGPVWVIIYVVVLVAILYFV